MATSGGNQGVQEDKDKEDKEEKGNSEEEAMGNSDEEEEKGSDNGLSDFEEGDDEEDMTDSENGNSDNEDGSVEGDEEQGESSVHVPMPGPESFSEFSAPAEVDWLLRIRKVVVDRLSTPPDKKAPHAWMTFTWVNAPGDKAQVLEAIYRACSPSGLRAFLLANCKDLPAKVFDEIMGVGRGGLIERIGLYWRSGPTLVATERVNRLLDGLHGVWLGACNGHWAVFKPTLTVRKLDVYPVGDGVKYHPCDGKTPYAKDGGLGFVMYSTSLPGPSFQPPVACQALRSLMNGGILVATDILGRDKETLGTFAALMMRSLLSTSIRRVNLATPL